MAKGGEFERKICVLLSGWWTGGADDGVFWRTANSGGRSTVRRKAGKKAKHHNGDVDAIDPCGKPLTDLLLIEIKRGYNRDTFADLLDRPVKAKEQRWEEWIAKAIRTCRESGAAFWFLIARRDRRECLCAFPLRLADELRDLGAVAKDAPVAVLKAAVNGEMVKFTVMLLADFLGCVTPSHIRHLARSC